MIDEKIEDVYGLSPMQAGMLFHSLYSAEHAVYLDQRLYALPGDLDIELFKRAWQVLIERHEVLRTSFHWEGLDEPLQVVHSRADLPLDVRDWSGFSGEEQRISFRTLLKEDRARGADLEQAPLMRVTLIRTGSTSWQFLWTSHHLLLDRWSSSHVLSELTKVYQAICQNKRIDLPGIRPYRDYIRWLRQQNPERAESYWRRSLAGFISPTSLPIDRSPCSLDSKGELGREHVRLSEEATSTLQVLARQHRLTLNTFVQGGWALLLSRYSREEDVLFGATVSGRPPELPGVESMVGMFINSLPVRIRLPAQKPLLDWLQNLQEAMLELREYEYSSLVQIQSWSDVPRGLPLFESLVVVQTGTPDEAGLKSFAASHDAVRTSTGTQGTGDPAQVRTIAAESSVDFPLYLIAVPDRRMLLRIHYDLSRYDGADIARLAGHLRVLLEGMAANPEQKLSHFTVLTQEERQQLLVDWNDTASNYPRDRCIHTLFEEQVQRTPEAVALVYEDQQFTYAELNRQANRLAHCLQSYGVKPDTLVAVCMNRSLDMVVALLGVLKAGGAYVALDPAYPAQRIEYTLGDSAAALLITQESLLDTLPQTQAQILCLDRDRERLDACPAHNPVSEVAPDSLAYVLYTSGSTGLPKGVAIEHHSPVALVSWALGQLTTEELSGVVFGTSICFDLSVYELFVTLCGGGRVLVVENALAIAGLPASLSPTLINTVPSAMAELLRMGAVPPSVCRVNLAGEPLSGSLVDTIYDQTEVKNVYDLYGPSEDTTYSTFALRERRGVVTIGRPIDNTDVYILDAQMSPVPIGVPGELYIGGDGLSRGYLNQPSLTAERFVPDPFSGRAGARLYRTGDLVRYLPDGNIDFLGRIDHQVKVRGFRIELGEIESVLLSHTSVRDAVVLAREDEPGEKRLVAYVASGVCEAALSASELREHLLSKLPVYMIPSAFVIIESLPLTPNGKVDRKALPAPEASLQVESYVAPRTPIEEGLCEIWCEVLRLEQVGIHDGFFDLGGHSLLATQVISRTRNTFGVDLPLRALFEAPTIGGLAQRIEELRGTEIASAPPLVRVSREGRLPLSFSQQRLWFLDQLEPDSPTYNIPMAVRLTGVLNVEALRQSLREIVRRHEALRTTFILEDGVPAQVIGEALPELEVVDLGDVATPDRESAVRVRVREEAQRPFDLARGPLLRASLLRRGDEEHILLLTLHHIVADGWSIGVLRRELATLYNAFCAGQPSPLTELPIQYADYASWQRGWLQGEVLDRQIGYWKERLTGAPTLLELPTDRPRPPVQTFRGATKRLVLSTELTQSLKLLGRQEGSTLFMTLLAAFQVLLSRYSGQDDIVVGTPIANRTRSETEGLIGFFLNTLALRGDLSGDPSFVELLGRLREVALSGYAHQDLPFEKLVDELQPERSMSHSPLFQAMLTLQNTGNGVLKLQGLQVEGLGGGGTSAKFDLTLALSESNGQLRGALEYNTDLFDEDRIERLLVHFQTLLEGIVADPEQKLSQLPLLPQSERDQLLVDWNDTACDYPNNLCIHQLFEEQVERTPDAIALVFEDQSLTYSQLNARANQLAHYLSKQGVGPDVLVGLCMERSIEMVVGILAVLKAGGAYVPLDPAYPAERLAFMLDDARPAVLLTLERLRSQEDRASLQTICLDLDWDQVASESTHNPIDTPTAEHLAYVIYTSGSTGQPKGVLASHGSLINATTARWRHYRENVTSFLLLSSVAFDSSVAGIFWTLTQGGSLILPAASIDITDLCKLIRSHRVSHLLAIPSLYTAILQEASSGDLASLQTVIVAGETCPPRLLQDHQRQIGNIPLFNEYGPTEGTVWCTVYNYDSYPSGISVLIGRPIANTQIYLLDEHLHPVPIGVPGELYIGGEGLARGYLNRPELTAEKFIANPFNRKPGARLYKTGDLAKYVPDGNIECLGRIDHQVKVRGFRIELGEIESTLLGHASIREAVVLAREDVPGDKRLVGYVVCEAESVLEPRTLQDYLKRTLPEYMVPSAFVILEALPLTHNGKVNRKSLPAPDAYGVQANAYVAPRNPIEEGLADIWGAVLYRECVGVHDSFFELGGHSLLATQVMSRIRSTFQVELPLRALFEAPSVAGLAERIEAAAWEENTSAPPLVRVSREQPLPLSFAQQRLWFLDQFEPGSALYNIPMALRLAGALNQDALQRSLETLVHRHEALRTTFHERDGEVVQVIQRPAPFILNLLNLIALGKEECELEAKRLVKAEAQLPFDLQRGPLFRAELLRLADEEHILLLTMHHIVSDGWSQGVLHKELSALYNGFSQGKASALPELPIQYADYAAWQRNWLQGEALDLQIGYWKQTLDGAPTLLELPTDRPRPSAQTFRGALKRLQFPESLSQSLKQLGQREGVTQFMTLLAAFQVLLSRYSGQEEIVVGTPIANRTRSETEGLIGFFLNTLALRGDLSGDPSFVELLKRVREVCLGAYAHQDLPFEKLVEELQPERSLSHSPLFQVMFTLNNTAGGAMELESLQVGGMGGGGVSAKFDLTLALSESNGQLRGALEYNTDLFDADRIERMQGHWQVLLEGIVADPEQKVSCLPLLTEPELQQLLVEWNTVPADNVGHPCVHQLFESQVARTPEAIALTFAGTSLTYEELNTRANRLAHYLRQRGAGPDVLVCLYIERSLEMVVGMLGILKAGSAYVPLDPAYPSERLSQMILDARTPLLLTQQALKADLPAHSSEIVCLDEDWERIALQSSDNPASGVGYDNLVYVIYTSGSTGKPKGTAVYHSGFSNLVDWFIKEFAFTATVRTLLLTSLSFDLTQKNVFGVLCVGGQLHLAPTGVYDPNVVAFAIATTAVTHLNCTPSHFYPLLAEVNETSYARLTSLRYVYLGGETIDLAYLRNWLGHACCHAQLVNSYGPTECSDVSTFYTMPRGLPPMDQTIPIGRPIPNVTHYIIDKLQRLVPVGVPGELYIGGDGVGRGYLQRPDLTAEKFVPDPFSGRAGARLYRTGDLCRYLSDGNIDFLGRIDYQVKVRGFRIELGEIESALLSHAGVREAVVLAREDVPGDRRLVAYVSTEAASGLETRALQDCLKQALPEYMVPTVFVIVESLPLTPNGKVDRKALPAPEANVLQEDTYVAPRTPIEEGLAEIWSVVLHVERIGVHDSFFDLGGHSLLATQVISRIRSSFAVELPLRTLFEAPTLAGLAEHVLAFRRSGAGLQLQPLKRVAREELLPLSFAQQRLWFIDRLNPGSAVYNVPSRWRIRGEMDVDALQSALEAIVARHEVLRSTFVDHNGNGMQVISPDTTFPFAIQDVSEMSDSACKSEVRRLCTQEAQTPFDLTSDRLIRGMLIRTADQDHLLLVTCHHIVSDGWSMGVFIRELSILYSAYQAAKPCVLPPLPIQYADYAVWQREALSGPVLDRLAEYWKSQLAEAPPLLELPVDRPRSLALSQRGDFETLILPIEINRPLKELSRLERATPFMTLLAVFNVLLYSYTNQLDIVVGTDDAGRNHADLEHLIGFFINHLVLRTNLSGNPSFREMVQRVREMTLEAYTHQDMPFDKLVELIRPDREASHTPLFQVLFVMQPAASDITADNIFSSSGINVGPTSSKYDIVLFVRDSPSGLAISWLYRTDLFDASTVRGMASDFEGIVRFAVSSPDTPIAELKGLVLDQVNRRADLAIEERRQSSRIRLRTRSQRVI